MATRRRGRGGRFVKASRKRRTYRTTRRRNPSTRKGQPRRGARLAYSKKPQGRVRRRRSNPTMFKPATRYALYAGGGAVGGFALDTLPSVAGVDNIIATIRNQGPAATGAARLTWVRRSTLVAAAVVAVAHFGLKGEWKRNMMAAGVGMFIPTVSSAVTTALHNANLLSAPTNDVSAHGRQVSHSAPRSMSAPRSNYNNAYLTASRGLNLVS